MRTRFLISLLLMFASAQAQDTVYFSQGLALNGLHRYGREAQYTDQLAFKLYSGSLSAPAEGQNFEGVAGTGWKLVKADSAHRFLMRGMNTGYLYLTYQSDKERPALLHVRGSGGLFFNGEPHAGDPYHSGWLYVPVKLKKGLNEIYLRPGGFMSIPALILNPANVSVHVADSTVPSIVLPLKETALKAAVVVINTTETDQKNLSIRSTVAGKTVVAKIPVVPAMSTRKVMFDLDASAVTNSGKEKCSVQLLNGSSALNEKDIYLDVAEKGKQYASTFISNIDGSLQYYGVSPQTNDSANGAFFLSVHGAGVEAIGQARAYKPKDWGNVVTPTNRRPRGFNWEDWGRLDALEVYEIGIKKFNPDPQRVYLTGHSMGGHGTWFLGATYPDKWAAIAPCAGYPTLKDYGSHDGRVPDSSASPVEAMLIRSSNQSDVIKLATNYKPLGVYIFHGDSDRVVPVTYARQMKNVLAGFHPDMSYYEYPGGEHWFGDISVDWNPLFQFFRWHQRPLDSAVNNIDFMTASPGISDSYRWVSIQQQEQPLAYSRVKLKRNRRAGTISGNTQNVRLIRFTLKEFGASKAVRITLDSLNTVEYTTKNDSDSIYLVKQSGSWTLTNKPGLDEKGPHRYGTLKDGFNYKMVYVYGTRGNKDENAWAKNKAKYDAETWYYRGNGAVDIISDKEYGTNGATKYAGRNVVLYGNATTNSAWSQLLADAPIQVSRGKVSVGGQTLNGDDLGAYFVWPLRNTSVNSVAVISGTGVKGMNAANANQYFAGASGFPDFMIFRLNMLKDGVKGIEKAGFFDNQWKLNENMTVSQSAAGN